MDNATTDSKTYWTNHISTWHESGLTQQAYCQQHGIKPHRFSYWKNKLEPRTKKKNTASRKPGFIPVNIVKTAPVSMLSVNLPNGVSITGIDEHNAPLVVRLTGALG